MSQFARRTSSQHSSSRQSQPEASTSRGRARAVVEESDDEDGGSGGRGGRGGREQPTLETRLNELSVPIPKPQMDEEFRHRPLDKDTSAQRIVMLCKEWHIVVKELEESMNVLGTAAADLQEAIADDDEEDEEAAEVGCAWIVYLPERLVPRRTTLKRCPHQLPRRRSNERTPTSEF